MFRKRYNYNLDGIYAGHHAVSYKGIPAIKCPFDFTLYQMILWEVKPDLVIEIGTNKGGTTLYIADLLMLFNAGEIHTIDVAENKEDPSLLRHPKIKIFKEGFAQYDITKVKGFKNILIIEDGSHKYEDSLNALNKFAPIVSKGSYYIVEDGIISALGKAKEYNGGPKKAIKEFLQQNDNFIVDKKWCNFFGMNATFNTNGYLKKL